MLVAALGALHFFNSREKLKYDSMDIGIEPVGDGLLHGTQTVFGGLMIAGGLTCCWPLAILAGASTLLIEGYKKWFGPDNSIRNGTTSFALLNYASKGFKNSGNSVYT